MFESLPDTLKQEVLKYLESDNFPAAKAIYDSWHQQKKQQKVKKKTKH